MICAVYAQNGPNPNSNQSSYGNLSSHNSLAAALASALAAENSGLNSQKWASIVDRIVPPNPEGTGGTGQGPGGAGGVGMSPSGFGHPECLNYALPSTLPAVQ